MGTSLTDSQLEAAIDRAVMRRLATDAAYLNAEDAETQAAREDEIAEQEWTRFHGPTGFGS